MAAMVLATLFRQRPIAGVAEAFEDKLTPAHAADLLPSAAEQDQEPGNFAALIITTAAPDRGKLVVTEHTIARFRHRWSAGANYRMIGAPALLHAPSVEGRKRATRRGGRVGTVRVG